LPTLHVALVEYKISRLHKLSMLLGAGNLEFVVRDTLLLLVYHMMLASAGWKVQATYGNLQGFVRVAVSVPNEGTNIWTQSPVRLVDSPALYLLLL